MLFNLLKKANERPASSRSSKSRRRKDEHGHRSSTSGTGRKSTPSTSSRGDGRGIADDDYVPASSNYSSSRHDRDDVGRSTVSSYATADSKASFEEDYDRSIPGSRREERPANRNDEIDSRDDERGLDGRRIRYERSRSGDRDEKRYQLEKEREREEKPRRRAKSQVIINNPSEYSRSRAGPMSSGDQGIMGEISQPGFSQFPIQYDNTSLGAMPEPGPSLDSHQIPVSHPSQFPHQQISLCPSPSPGQAAEYYGDQGQSVASQPGVRPNPPSLIVGAEPHLMAASSTPNPPTEPSSMGQAGQAADYYGGASPTIHQQHNDGYGESVHYSQELSPKPSKPSKPSIPAAAAVAGVATYGIGSMLGGSNEHTAMTSSSCPNYHPPPPHQPQHQPQQPYYPPTNGSRPPKPNKHNSMPAVGAAMPGAVAGYAAATSHTPTFPRPNTFSGVAHHHQGQSVQLGPPGQPGSLAYHQRHHGPFRRFVNFWKDPEAVAQFEEYSEYIGVCKFCFEPGTSPRDAPRKHVPRRRRSSDEHLDSRVRVDKLSRYPSSSGDESRRKKSNKKSWLAAGLAGYVAKSLLEGKDGFDGSYSARSGQPASDAMSTSTTSLGKKSRTSRGTTKHSNRTSSPMGIVSHGYGRDDRSRYSGSGGRYSNGDDSYHRRRRSRSRSRSRSQSKSRERSSSGLKAATVAAGALGAASVLTSGSRRSRGRSPKKLSRGQYSSSNGSTIDISRSYGKPGLSGLASFFTAPSEKRPKAPKVPIVKEEVKKKEKARKGIFSLSSSFSAGSSASSFTSSSDDADLAFGTGFIGAPHSEKEKSRPERNEDHKVDDAALLGLGATAVRLAASASYINYGKGRQDGSSSHSSRSPYSIYRHDSRPPVVSGPAEEDGWVSASDDSSPSSVDSALAYGGPSTSFSSSDSGTSKWGWRWGNKKKSLKTTKYQDHRYPDTRQHAQPPPVAGYSFPPQPLSTVGSLLSMQNVYPIPTQDPSQYDVTNKSSYSSSQPYVQPQASLLIGQASGPAHIQHPQPIVPVSQALYTTQAELAQSYDAPSGPPFLPRSSGESDNCCVTELQSGVGCGIAPLVDKAERSRYYRDSNQRSNSSPNARESELRRRDSSPVISHTRDESPRPKQHRRYTTSQVQFDLTEEQEDKERRQLRDEEERETRRTEREFRSHVEEERRERKKEKDGRGADWECETERQYEPLDRKTFDIDTGGGRRDVSTGSSWITPVATAAGAASIASLISELEERKRREERRQQRRKERRGYVDEREPGAEEREEEKRDHDSSAGPTGKDRVTETELEFDIKDIPATKIRLARKAAGRVAASPVHDNYADYFVPAEVLSGGDETSIHSHSDAGSPGSSSPNIILIEPRSVRLEREMAAMLAEEVRPLGVLPWPVPRLNLIHPTPPHSTEGSVIGEEPPPPPPVPPKVTVDVERDISPSRKSDSGIDIDEIGRVREVKGEVEVAETKSEQKPEPEPTPVTESHKVEEPLGKVAHLLEEPRTPQPVIAEVEDADIDEEIPLHKHIPGAFGNDFEFAATLAAGAALAGFNSAVVTEDPTYHQRDSPPGSEGEGVFTSPVAEAIFRGRGSPPGVQYTSRTYGYVEDEELGPSYGQFAQESVRDSYHSRAENFGVDVRESLKSADDASIHGLTPTAEDDKAEKNVEKMVMLLEKEKREISIVVKRESRNREETWESISEPEPPKKEQEPEKREILTGKVQGLAESPVVDKPVWPADALIDDHGFYDAEEGSPRQFESDANSKKEDREAVLAAADEDQERSSKKDDQTIEPRKPTIASTPFGPQEEEFDSQETKNPLRTDKDDYTADQRPSIPGNFFEEPKVSKKTKKKAKKAARDALMYNNNYFEPEVKSESPPTGVDPDPELEFETAKASNKKLKRNSKGKSKKFDLDEGDKSAASIDDNFSTFPARAIEENGKNDKDEADNGTESVAASVSVDADEDAESMKYSKSKLSKSSSKSKRRSKRHNEPFNENAPASASVVSSPARLVDDSKPERRKGMDGSKRSSSSGGSFFGFFGASKSRDSLAEEELRASARDELSETGVEDLEEASVSSSKRRRKKRSSKGRRECDELEGDDDDIGVSGSHVDGVEKEVLDSAHIDKIGEVGEMESPYQRRRKDRRHRYEEIVESGRSVDGQRNDSHSIRSDGHDHEDGDANKDYTEDQSFLGTRPEMPSTHDGASGLLDSTLQKHIGGNESRNPTPATTPRSQSRSRPVSSSPSSSNKKALSIQVDPRSTSHIVASPTAVPIHFRRPKPSSGVKKSAASASPGTLADLADSPTSKLGGGSKRPRSTEFKTSREFRPLWLVEQHGLRKLDRGPDEPYPALPSSKTTSRTSSVEVLKGYGLEQGFTPGVPYETQSFAERSPRIRPLSLQLDNDNALHDAYVLEAQLATPTAASFCSAAHKKEKPKPEFHSPSELLLDPFWSQTQLPASPTQNLLPSPEITATGETVIASTDWDLDLENLLSLRRSLTASSQLGETLPPLPESRPPTSHSETGYKLLTGYADMDNFFPPLPESRPSTSHTQVGSQLTEGLSAGVIIGLGADVAANLVSPSSSKTRGRKGDIVAEGPHHATGNIEVIIATRKVSIQPTREVEPTSTSEIARERLHEVTDLADLDQGNRNQPMDSSAVEYLSSSLSETIIEVSEDSVPRTLAAEEEHQLQLEASTVSVPGVPISDAVPYKPLPRPADSILPDESVPSKSSKTRGDDIQLTSSMNSKMAKDNMIDAFENTEILPSGENISKVKHRSVYSEIEDDKCDASLMSEIKPSQENQDLVAVENSLRTDLLEPLERQPTGGLLIPEELSGQVTANSTDPELEFSNPKKKGRKGKGKQKKKASKVVSQETKGESLTEPNQPPCEEEPSSDRLRLLSDKAEDPTEETIMEFNAVNIHLPDSNDEELAEPAEGEFIPDLKQCSETETMEEVSPLDMEVYVSTFQLAKDLEPEHIPLPENVTELEELTENDYISHPSKHEHKGKLERVSRLPGEKVQDPTPLPTRKLDLTELPLQANDSENEISVITEPNWSDQKEKLEVVISPPKRKAEGPAFQPPEEIDSATIPLQEDKEEIHGFLEAAEHPFGQPPPAAVEISQSADIVSEDYEDNSLLPKSLKSLASELSLGGEVPHIEFSVDNTERNTRQPNKKKGKKGKKGRKYTVGETETGDFKASEAEASKEVKSEQPAGTVDSSVQDIKELESVPQFPEGVDTGPPSEKATNESAEINATNYVSPHPIGEIDIQIDTSTKASKKQKRKDKEKQKLLEAPEGPPIQSGSSNDIPLVDIVTERSTEYEPKSEKLTAENDIVMGEATPAGLPNAISKDGQPVDDVHPLSQLKVVEDPIINARASPLAENYLTSQNTEQDIGRDCPTDTAIAGNALEPSLCNEELVSKELESDKLFQHDTPAIDTQKSKKGKKSRRKRQSVICGDEASGVESFQPKSASLHGGDANEPQLEIEPLPFTSVSNPGTKASKSSKEKRKAKKDKKWTTDDPSTTEEHQLSKRLERADADATSEPLSHSRIVEIEALAKPTSYLHEDGIERSIAELSEAQSFSIRDASDMPAIPGAWADDDDQVLYTSGIDNETVSRNAPPANDDGNEFQILKNKNKMNKKKCRFSDWTDESTSLQIEMKDISESTTPDPLRQLRKPSTASSELPEATIPKSESFQVAPEFAPAQSISDAENSQESFTQAGHIESSNCTYTTSEIPRDFMHEPVSPKPKGGSFKGSPLQPSVIDGDKLLDVITKSERRSSGNENGLVSVSDEREELRSKPPNPGGPKTEVVIQAGVGEVRAVGETTEDLIVLTTDDSVPSDDPVSKTLTMTEVHALSFSVEEAAPLFPQLSPQPPVSEDFDCVIENATNNDSNSVLEQGNIVISPTKEIDLLAFDEPLVALRVESKKQPQTKDEDRHISSNMDAQNLMGAYLSDVMFSEDILLLALPESCDPNSTKPDIGPVPDPQLNSEPDSWNATSTEKGKKKYNKKSRDTHENRTPTTNEPNTNPFTDTATTFDPGELILELTNENIDRKACDWDVPITMKDKEKNTKSLHLEESSFPTQSTKILHITENPSFASADAEYEGRDILLSVTSTDEGKKNNTINPVLQESNVIPGKRLVGDHVASEENEVQFEQREADSLNVWATNLENGDNKNKEMDSAFGKDKVISDNHSSENFANVLDDAKPSGATHLNAEQKEVDGWSTTSTKKGKTKNRKTQAVQDDPSPLAVPEPQTQMEFDPQTELSHQEWNSTSEKPGKKIGKSRDGQPEGTLVAESLHLLPKTTEPEPSKSPSRGASKKEKKAKKKGKRELWGTNDDDKDDVVKAIQVPDEPFNTINRGPALPTETQTTEAQALTGVHATEAQIIAAEKFEKDDFPALEKTARSLALEQKLQVANEIKETQSGVDNGSSLPAPANPELNPHETKGDYADENYKDNVWEGLSNKKILKKDKKNKKGTRHAVDVEEKVEKPVEDVKEVAEPSQEAVPQESASLKRFLSKKEKKKKQLLKFDESTTQPELLPILDVSATEISPEKDDGFTEVPQNPEPTESPIRKGVFDKPQNEDYDYWPSIDWLQDKALNSQSKPKELDTSSLDLFLSGDEPNPREDHFTQQSPHSPKLVDNSIGDFDEDASLVGQSGGDKSAADSLLSSSSKRVPPEHKCVSDHRPESVLNSELPSIPLDADVGTEALLEDFDVAGLLKENLSERLPSPLSVPQSPDAVLALEKGPAIESPENMEGAHPSIGFSAVTISDDFWAVGGSKQKKSKKGKGKKKALEQEGWEILSHSGPLADDPADTEPPGCNTTKALPEMFVESPAAATHVEAVEPPIAPVITRMKDDNDSFCGVSGKKGKNGKGLKKRQKDQQDVHVDEGRAPHQLLAETLETHASKEVTSSRSHLEEHDKSQPSGVVASVFPFLERVSRRYPSEDAASKETPTQEIQSASTKDYIFPLLSDLKIDAEVVSKFEDSVKCRPSLDPIPEIPAAVGDYDHSIDVSYKHSEPELPVIKHTLERRPSFLDSISERRSSSPSFLSSPLTRVDVEHSRPVSHKPAGRELSQSSTVYQDSKSLQSGSSVILPAISLRRQKETGASPKIPPLEQPHSIFGGPFGLGGDHDVMVSPPRTPLATIKEHVPTDSPRNARNRELSDVGSRDRGVKAARHTENPHPAFGPKHVSPPRKFNHASTPSHSSSDAAADRGLASQLDTLDIPKKGRVDRFPTSQRRSPGNPHPHEWTTSPEHRETSQSLSVGSTVSSGGSPVPGLRRVPSTSSTDLRAASKHDKITRFMSRDPERYVEGIASSSHYDPVIDKGKRPVRGMEDVYEGWGDVPGSSPRSPTRPQSMRRRRSLQHLQDLETRVDHLVSENRLLSTQKANAEKFLESQTIAQRQAERALQTRDQDICSKDLEILQLKNTLEWFKKEIARLIETNDVLTATNTGLVASHASEMRQHAESKQHLFESQQGLRELQDEHSQLSAGLEGIVQNEINNILAEKNAELEHLRSELANARDKVKELQIQIMETMADDVLVFRDEDYFDAQCQKLCQHVQQWVLRFSKFSDMRLCRLTSALRDEKVTARFANAILDGSDVDTYLSDRVRRRDVFMSVVMTLVWEYIFTRYLFGMDREQRQKLKTLEKQLSEVGPPSAVQQWRATTLALLAKRQAFHEQRSSDTEAVVQEIYYTLSKLLPPPRDLESTILESLRNVMRAAVDLSIEMRTQRAEYIMLPPLQPEHNANGELARKVHFKAALMNERSGETTSNEELEAQEAVVRIVLFPLVVKKCSDEGDGDEEIVVCPAQVLVARPGKDKKVVRVLSGDRMSIDQTNQSIQSLPSISIDPGNVI
ncbi:hypothetical protein GX48_04806 [Paracoccidioides brasiliensis]|nr:hypothetical protein GX48_04806 [Paracoccidioides brasiliensis]